MKAIHITQAIFDKNKERLTGFAVGSVKKFTTLPDFWVNPNGSPTNSFHKASEARHELNGFFPYDNPTLTEYQSLELLIDTDFNGTSKEFEHRKRDWSQQEIDDHEQQKLDEDPTAKRYETRIADGYKQFKRFVDHILREKDEGNITPQKALLSIATFEPAMQHLKDGWQELTKQKVNALVLTEPFDITLQAMIITTLTTYINENPI